LKHHPASRASSAVFKADGTGHAQQITGCVAAFNRSACPSVSFSFPAAPTILPELLTSDTILAALAKAV